MSDGIFHPFDATFSSTIAWEDSADYFTWMTLFLSAGYFMAAQSKFCPLGLVIVYRGLLYSLEKMSSESWTWQAFRPGRT